MNSDLLFIIGVLCVAAPLLFLFLYSKPKVIYYPTTQHFRIKIGFVWWLYRDGHTHLYETTPNFEMTAFGGIFYTKESAVRALEEFRSQKAKTVDI